jgi:hypothetical protein
MDIDEMGKGDCNMPELQKPDPGWFGSFAFILFLILILLFFGSGWF